MDEYRRRSMLIGKQITILQDEHCEQVTCTGVDNMGRLLIRRSSGSEEALSSGSVLMEGEKPFVETDNG